MTSTLPPLDKSRRYALLVAIDSYPNPRDSLPSPRQDAAAIATALSTRFGIESGHILQLTNRAANRDSIIAAFQNHLSKADSNGLALFYFVGHGLDLDSNYSIQDPELSRRDQALFVWGANGGGAILLDDELNVLIRDLRAHRRIVIIDACYSGTSIKYVGGLAYRLADTMSSREYLMSTRYAAPGIPAEIPEQFISDGQLLADIDSLPLVFISAADEKEPAWSVTNWPTPKQSRSVFSYYFEGRLNSYDVHALVDDLLKDVRADIAKRPACLKDHTRCQTPQIRGPLGRERLETLLGSR